MSKKKKKCFSTIKDIEKKFVSVQIDALVAIFRRLKDKEDWEAERIEIASLFPESNVENNKKDGIDRFITETNYFHLTQQIDKVRLEFNGTYFGNEKRGKRDVLKMLTFLEASLDANFYLTRLDIALDIEDVKVADILVSNIKNESMEIISPWYSKRDKNQSNLNISINPTLNIETGRTVKKSKSKTVCYYKHIDILIEGKDKEGYYRTKYKNRHITRFETSIFDSSNLLLAVKKLKEDISEKEFCETISSEHYQKKPCYINDTGKEIKNFRYYKLNETWEKVTFRLKGVRWKEEMGINKSDISLGGATGKVESVLIRAITSLRNEGVSESEAIEMLKKGYAIDKKLRGEKVELTKKEMDWD